MTAVVTVGFCVLTTTAAVDPTLLRVTAYRFTSGILNHAAVQIDRASELDAVHIHVTGLNGVAEQKRIRSAS